MHAVNLRSAALLAVAPVGEAVPANGSRGESWLRIQNPKPNDVQVPARAGTRPRRRPATTDGRKRSSSGRQRRRASRAEARRERRGGVRRPYEDDGARPDERTGGLAGGRTDRRTYGGGFKCEKDISKDECGCLSAN